MINLFETKQESFWSRTRGKVSKQSLVPVLRRVESRTVVPSLKRGGEDGSWAGRKTVGVPALGRGEWSEGRAHPRAGRKCHGRTRHEAMVWCILCFSETCSLRILLKWFRTSFLQNSIAISDVNFEATVFDSNKYSFNFWFRLTCH